jgi:hypothetical protein
MQLKMSSIENPTSALLVETSLSPDLYSNGISPGVSKTLNTNLTNQVAHKRLEKMAFKAQNKMDNLLGYPGVSEE